MNTLFSQRNKRYTTIVLVFVWLMTLGISIANACVINPQGLHGTVAHVEANRHDEAVHEPVAADKSLCLDVCADEQTSAFNANQLDTVSGAHVMPVVLLGALTVSVVDLGDQAVSADLQFTHEIPVSIRFLRLTI